MQIRTRVAAVVGTGIMIASGVGLATAVPSLASAPSSTPASPTASPVPLSTVAPTGPATTAAPTVAPSAPGQRPGIEVPAGHVSTSTRGTGASMLDVEILLAVGAALIGAATVVVARRRS